MNTPKTSELEGSNSVYSQAPQVIKPTYTHYKQSKLQNLLNSPKKRFAVFTVMFGVVGAVALAVSFAATSQERDLVIGFRNLAKNRPTTINGSGSITYNDSVNFKNAAINFTTNLDHKTGNSSGKGQLRINKTVFPYEYVTFNKNHYFKLGNTPAVREAVKPGNPTYPYFASRLGALDQINNMWMVQTPQASNGVPKNTGYDCALNSNDIRLTATDAQKLQKSLLRNSPFKVDKVTNTTIGGEAVTQSWLVLNNTKAVDAFARATSELDAVKKIDSCSQKIASTPAVPKVRDALVNNNVKISVYMNANKVIKKITLTGSGKKANLQLTADFRYAQPATITRITGAAPAGAFIRKMTAMTSTSDQQKEADLATLNQAIEKYIIKYRSLPLSLRDISGLAPRLADYGYGYTSINYNGGPTLTYRTCADFTYPGVGSTDYTEVFKNHTAGKSCFDNGFYKGQSHIKQVLPSGTDRAKEADLYKINLALENYMKQNSRLPAKLSDLKLSGLKGKLTDYEYKYDSLTTGGGPTLSYTTCATFQYPGPGAIYGENSLTPELFTAHEGYRGCYHNGYYKSSSHISFQIR